MPKLLTSLFGVISYLVGLTGLTAFMLYVGGWSFLPLHINSRMTDESSVETFMINLFIMILFGLHHSVAARPHFKKKLSQYIPVAAERSSYVLVSGLFMYAICLFWQPLAGVIWNTDNAAIVLTLKIVHVTGWLILVGATFEINHFQLMGLKQSLTANTSDGEFKEKFLYRIVRHPIQTGILIGIWSTASMSMTQFILSLCLTIYVFIGLYFEEKALESQFGQTYLNYKKRVPGIIPFWPRKR